MKCLRIVRLASFTTVLGLSGGARAWDSGLHQDFDQSLRPAFTDAYAASVWGSLKAREYTTDPRWIYSKVETGSLDLEVPSVAMHSGHFHLKLFLQAADPNAWPEIHGASGELNVDPASLRATRLVVVLPGSFNDPGDPIARRRFESFARRGYHVALIANPLSASYFAENPVDAPSSLGAEARVVIRGINFLRAQLGPAVASVEVVGESYGALLASAVMAQYADVERATLFAPPLDLRVSQSALDVLLHTFMPYRATIVRARVPIALSYVAAREQSALPTLLDMSSVAMAPGVFAILGFQDPLVISATSFATAHGLPAPPADLDFAGFEQNEVGNAQAGSDGQLALWIHRAEALRPGRIRVLSAVDDVVNPRLSDWDPLREDLGDRLWLLSSAGHMGFEGSDAFEDFLDRAFAPRVDPLPRYLHWNFDPMRDLRVSVSAQR